jgi:hypothetical protein
MKQCGFHWNKAPITLELLPAIVTHWERTAKPITRIDALATTLCSHLP